MARQSLRIMMMVIHGDICICQEQLLEMQLDQVLGMSASSQNGRVSHEYTLDGDERWVWQVGT